MSSLLDKLLVYVHLSISRILWQISSVYLLQTNDKEYSNLNDDDNNNTNYKNNKENDNSKNISTSLNKINK